MLPKRIGIDLGTANVLVYVKGRGIVVNEPSVVALANRDNTVVAVGREAQEMMGRVPGSISRHPPHARRRDRRLPDHRGDAPLLHQQGRRPFQPGQARVMVCIPAGVTSVEQRAVRDAAEQAGGRRPVHLVPEPLAAAIGARIPVNSPSGNMVVDIGGGRMRSGGDLDVRHRRKRERARGGRPARRRDRRRT